MSSVVSPFYYRVIEFTGAGDRCDYMPQRGVLDEKENELWFDGVPAAAPTLELAKEWLHSMVAFDLKRTPGKTVWVLGISPD
jgi:hypothetical protein